MKSVVSSLQVRYKGIAEVRMNYENPPYEPPMHPMTFPWEKAAPRDDRAFFQEPYTPDPYHPDPYA